MDFALTLSLFLSLWLEPRLQIYLNHEPFCVYIIKGKQNEKINQVSARLHVILDLINVGRSNHKRQFIECVVTLNVEFFFNDSTFPRKSESRAEIIH